MRPLLSSLRIALGGFVPHMRRRFGSRLGPRPSLDDFPDARFAGGGRLFAGSRLTGFLFAALVTGSVSAGIWHTAEPDLRAATATSAALTSTEAKSPNDALIAVVCTDDASRALWTPDDVSGDDQRCWCRAQIESLVDDTPQVAFAVHVPFGLMMSDVSSKAAAGKRAMGFLCNQDSRVLGCWVGVPSTPEWKRLVNEAVATAQTLQSSREPTPPTLNLPVHLRPLRQLYEERLATISPSRSHLLTSLLRDYAESLSKRRSLPPPPMNWLSELPAAPEMSRGPLASFIGETEIMGGGKPNGNQANGNQANGDTPPGTISANPHAVAGQTAEAFFGENGLLVDAIREMTVLPDGSTEIRERRTYTIGLDPYSGQVLPRHGDRIPKQPDPQPPAEPKDAAADWPVNLLDELEQAFVIDLGTRFGNDVQRHPLVWTHLHQHGETRRWWSTIATPVLADHSVDAVWPSLCRLVFGVPLIDPLDPENSKDPTELTNQLVDRWIEQSADSPVALDASRIDWGRWVDWAAPDLGKRTFADVVAAIPEPPQPIDLRSMAQLAHRLNWSMKDLSSPSPPRLIVLRPQDPPIVIRWKDLHAKSLASLRRQLP